MTIENVDETTSKLIIATTALEDTGEYSCEFDTDNEKLEFINTPTYHEFLEGSTAVIPCQATGLPEVDIKWQKSNDGRGLAITTATSGFVCDRITVLEDRSLRIANTRQGDQGTYTCEASIKGRPISERKAISIVINAHAVCVPSPPSSDETRYVFNSDRSMLTIPSVVRGDFGEYTCIATNKIGEDSGSIILDGTEHPTVSVSESVMVVSPGMNISVTCEGSGHPAPKVKWVRKDTRAEMVLGSTLEFKKVQPSDGGLYTCVGSNSAGTDTEDFLLQTLPGTPSQFRVIPGPASASIILEANLVDGGSPITQYILEWKQEDEENWSQATFQLNDSLVVTPLRPYTKYSIRFATENSLGLGGFSTPQTVRTLAKGEPDSPVLMTKLSTVEKDSFTIPLGKPEKGGSPILHYVIRFKSDVDGEDWKQMQVPSNATGIELSGLHYNSSYQMEVTAVNLNGSSSPTPFRFSVPEAQPSKTGMSKAGVIGIVLFIFLLLLLVVDATCCYTNRCGLLMFLANGVQSEVTCDKAPLTKFEKAPPTSDPATEA
ncbi:hypothetical protein JZ751_004735 [Albula glossodonta]|uniref:Neural cell adhesion molecule 1-like n=1 Tax=Albula glossodonta TaxID=121402 RepID=A0A8T2N582_9TELE|nr:hypothetical protein JZ751_004735 [Albula glossodonta]